MLTLKTDYLSTIDNYLKIERYNEPVIFHCYWNGDLSSKHYASIKSCYYFNIVNNPNNKIILWLENNTKNKYNEKIANLAEIKEFSLGTFTKENIKVLKFLIGKQITYIGGSAKGISEKSNFYRLLFLYVYGGCWFDLDCFFLRSFDPIFSTFGNKIGLYRWEDKNYPNNAIVISLEVLSEDLKNIILFFIQRNRGWGFQRSKITFDLPLPMIIYPCSWFDASWVKNPYNISCDDFFKTTTKTYTFENFYQGSFCFHWHNRWNKPIEENSIIHQLDNIINNKLFSIVNT